MSHEAKKRSRVWSGWVAIALLLVAYPLSIGPILRYCDLGSGVLLIYEPIEQCCRWWEPLGDLKDWYTGLWGVLYRSDRATNNYEIIRFSVASPP
jgi:hypothetical protein